jgi:hypothetical protein
LREITPVPDVLHDRIAVVAWGQSTSVFRVRSDEGKKDMDIGKNDGIEKGEDNAWKDHIQCE